jgi:hypothetical protein
MLRVLLLGCVMLQAMTNVNSVMNSVHALPAPMVLLPWWATLQATSSMNPVHALPVAGVVLTWHPTLQARPSATPHHALPVMLRVLLLGCVMLQAMTNVNSVHALQMSVVLLLRCAGLQATS